MKKQWAAKITTIKNTTIPTKIYAEILSDDTISNIKNYLDQGFGIWTESALNEIITSYGLSCDQAETGVGFATFKKISY